MFSYIITFILGALMMVGAMIPLMPEDKPCTVEKIEECTKIDKAFLSAIENCMEDLNYSDYECFRYMNTGRMKASPSPKPTATPQPKVFQKYKPYYETESEE